MAELTPRLSESLTGTWELASRVTLTTDGRTVPSPFGADPVALLIYDGCGNFAAQFMKRDRDPEALELATPGSAAPNNSRTVNGYDAYFGRYSVDDEYSAVTQTLTGSLSPENVGQVLTRTMSVSGDELTIKVDTASPEGHAAVITLTWRRLSN